MLNYSKGEEDKPVLVTSSDTTSRGILVIRGKERSRLTHTKFNYLNHPKENGWQLPGAVTFYESPVDISHCSFADNKVGDDFLNIVMMYLT